MIDVEPIDEHHFENRTIPSGLFAQPEAEDLSGVIFSNAHTVAMFNRIGYERGYGDPTVAMCRVGWAIDPNPNASQPQKFGYVVGDRPPEDLETFSEGLHLFINPWARNQLSPDTLPAITYHEHIDDGQTLSTNRGGLQPLVSKTYIFEGENAPLYARYHQLKFLDLVPPLPKSDT